MKIEIKSEQFISEIIEHLEDSLLQAEEELQEAHREMKGIEIIKFESEELYKENESFRNKIAELEKDVNFKTAEADRLKDIDERCRELTEKNTEAWDRIRELEKENEELKREPRPVSLDDLYETREENAKLERRIDELLSENNTLKRRMKKHSEAGAVIAEVLGQAPKKPGRPKKGAEVNGN